MMVHSGDHFVPLDSLSAHHGGAWAQAPPVPESSYAPIWCAWGYERNFTPEQVYGTLDKAKAVGCEWAVLDDGWQKSVGDWVADTGKFPDGNAGIKAFASRIKSYGMRPKLWISPLSAAPASDLMREHRDMLLLDADGAAQNVTWWNSYYFVPGVPADHRLFQRGHPADHRRLGLRGSEDRRAGPQRRRALLQSRAQPCPPGGIRREAAGFLEGDLRYGNRHQPGRQHRDLPVRRLLRLLQYSGDEQHPGVRPGIFLAGSPQRQDVQGDDESAAPFSGDHVELSDGGDDFASTYGIGGIPSTKFTWPKDTDKPTDELPPGGFVLTPEKEQLWSKWIALYRKNMLSKGQYRGELYDIGFDKPEGHVVTADGKLHYAFYAKQWSGPIELRGLGTGQYRLTDSFTGAPLGTATAGRQQDQRPL